jgi:phosphatidylserine decarboxylase
VVRDGIYYGIGFALGAVVVALALGWPWALPLCVLGGFIIFFFRDPERTVPADPALVVSPADGRVTAIETLAPGAEFGKRISIFLSIFDVHVNRAPVSGTVREIDYRRGRFTNALRANSAVNNEQNVVRIEGEQPPVTFAQIAGAIARRIVFHPKVGDHVERGQRVGLIKFGSRVDVLLSGDSEVLVARGQHVSGGCSALARVPVRREKSSVAVQAEESAGTSVSCQHRRT